MMAEGHGQRLAQRSPSRSVSPFDAIDYKEAGAASIVCGHAMRFHARKLLLAASASAFIGGSAFVSQHWWWEHGLRSLQAISTQRVQLVTSAVRAEVNRQDHLPLLLSLDANVQAALTSPADRGNIDRVNRKLQRVGLEADARAIYVVGLDGTVLASDDWDREGTRVGRNVSELAYFRQAVANGRSAILQLDADTGRMRYFLAEAVREREVLGVVVVRIEFDSLEGAWRRGGERVVVVDRSGIAFLDSESTHKHRRISIGGGHKAPQPGPAQNGADLNPIFWEVLERRGESSVVQAPSPADGSSYLHESMSLPEFGWTVHRLADLTSVRNDQRDGAIIGGVTSALLLSVALYMLQRHRAYILARDAGIQLKQEVDNRTRELRDSNASLRSEVEERRRAEARLRATQNELLQAGKLAALGRMSAALAHEINQPLAAIQTFIASTRIFAQRGDTTEVVHNIDLISDLADRMAKLSAHLKTFARKSEPGHHERVPIDRVLDGAQFLVESRTRSGRVSIERDIEPGLTVDGHTVQLEQVVVNLLINALDAVAGVRDPWIRVRAHASQNKVIISIADNGSGIPAELVERIFDPFVTTKPVGQGLGLGLSISYGIVQGLQGRIYAVNLPEGGAEVTIELSESVEAISSVTEMSHAG
jgi:two-component system, NtrC family, C4-dicarboxylate transport sensor histidine kinase DctB